MSARAGRWASWAVALEAHDIGRLDQVGVVLGAVNVVATEAAHAVRIHLAGDKIVALHPVLVGGAVREMSEGGLAELVLFELPEIRKVLTDSKPTGQS